MSCICSAWPTCYKEIQDLVSSKKIVLLTNSRLIRESRLFIKFWWRHLEYYWLIKYVSIVNFCSSIGRTQGCGSHTRFSLWQLFYNTSSWFMGAIYFPFSVHTKLRRELHTFCCYSPNMCFYTWSYMQRCNVSCC